MITDQTDMITEKPENNHGVNPTVLVGNEGNILKTENLIRVDCLI